MKTTFRNWASCALALSLLLGCQQKPADPSETPLVTTLTMENEASEASAAPGPNPRFYSVQQQLDQGGSFYLYADLKDALHDGVAELRDALGGTAGPPEIKAYLDGADRVIERLGLYGLDDLGISVLPEEGGLNRSKIFISTPGGRKGLTGLLGGEPHPFAVLEMAPPDALLVRSVDFDAPALLALVRDLAQDIAGVQGQGAINNALTQVQMGTGLPVEAIINSLAGETMLILSQDSQLKIRFPIESQTIEIGQPHVVLAMRTSDATLYNALRQTIDRLGKTQTAKQKEGELSWTPMAVPENPYWNVTPVIAAEPGFFYFATGIEDLQKIRATRDGGPNITTSEEFKTVGRGLPAEGNAMLYVSGQLSENLKDFSRQLFAAIEAQATGGGMGEQEKQIQRLMNRLTEKMQGATSQAYGVRVNRPEGIHWVSRSCAGADQMVAMAAVAPIAIMAAIAVPNFMEAQTRAKIRRVEADMQSVDTAVEEAQTRSKVGRARADMRTLNVALEAYNIDFNSYPLIQRTGEGGDPANLTTPIGYVSQYFDDPFVEGNRYRYWRTPEAMPGQAGWILWSAGPDGRYDITYENVGSIYQPKMLPALDALQAMTYDPTNGTTSAGDIWRIWQ